MKKKILLTSGWFCIALFSLLLLWPASIRVAHSAAPTPTIPPPIDIHDPQISYTFGGQIHIHTTVDLSSSKQIIGNSNEIQQVIVFLKPQGILEAQQGQAIFQPTDQPNRWSISYTHNLASSPMRAFTTVSYWFGIRMKSGHVVTSKVHAFYYEDNRYAWQTLDAPPFKLHWYEGGSQLAHEVFNTAWDGLTRTQTILPLEPPDEVHIYIYTSAREVQSTLQLGGLSWIAGHADPDLGVIAVSLPPGPDQRQEMARQIPHEMMHILLYHKTGESYRNLPTWFNEGLATMVELYPDPNYPTLIKNAYQKNTLMPFSVLCKSFPNDVSGALLAYAQSSSFVKYILEKKGQAGLETLLEEYQHGNTCEDGFELGYALSLSKFNQDWVHDTFEILSTSNIGETLFAWSTLLGLILFIPIGLGFWNLKIKSAL